MAMGNFHDCYLGSVDDEFTTVPLLLGSTLTYHCADSMSGVGKLESTGMKRVPLGLSMVLSFLYSMLFSMMLVYNSKYNIVLHVSFTCSSVCFHFCRI